MSTQIVSFFDCKSNAFVIKYKGLVILIGDFMNVYDFDRTLFPGDSSIHFWRFCIKKYPSVLLVLPKASVAMVKYWAGKYVWGDVMQTFFGFLKHVPEITRAVEDFWDEKYEKIYPWFFEKRTPDDVIISAAPKFLIDPVAKRLGVRCIATDMDIKTGVISGGECSGEAKLRRFCEKYPDARIDSFYSDSYSDTPLAKVADKAFMVFDGEVREWDFEAEKQ